MGLRNALRFSEMATKWWMSVLGVWGCLGGRAGDVLLPGTASGRSPSTEAARAVRAVS